MKDSYSRIVHSPVLYFSRSKDGVKDDSDEMNTGGNQKDMAPLIFNFLHRRVVFGDLLGGNGTNHAWEGANSITDAH